MDNCHASISIRRNNPCGDVQTNNLSHDLTCAFERYGVYAVRRAAVQQISGVNVNALADVGLSAYTNFDDLLDISNTAFHSMTPEERHREVCANLKMDFWWPVGG